MIQLINHMLIDKKYNPEKHHRQSLRLRGFDYSRCGICFITICCQDKIARFGKIDTGLMICNEFGNIALTQMAELPTRFHTVEIDTFQIMPNHIHMIIVLHPVGATLAVAPTNDRNQNMAYKPMTTSIKAYPTRLPCGFMDKQAELVIDQMRGIDKSRLARKMGVLDKQTSMNLCKLIQETFEY